jgi:hypothetical protein
VSAKTGERRGHALEGQQVSDRTEQANHYHAHQME